MLRSQHRVYDGSGEVARTQDVWGAEGISGRVKFLPLAWAGMPKTSFRKNSDSPLFVSEIIGGLYSPVFSCSMWESRMCTLIDADQIIKYYFINLASHGNGK